MHPNAISKPLSNAQLISIHQYNIGKSYTAPTHPITAPPLPVTETTPFPSAETNHDSLFQPSACFAQEQVER